MKYIRGKSGFVACRYGDILDELLDTLGAIKILRESHEADYQGYVDIDVLIDDDKIFTYKYLYGSCSVCDGWEANNLSTEQIKEAMLTEATIFDNIDEYAKWRKMCNDRM